MKHSFFYSILRGRTEWYWFFLTILLAGFGYILGQLPLTGEIFNHIFKMKSIGYNEFFNCVSNNGFSDCLDSYGVSQELLKFQDPKAILQLGKPNNYILILMLMMFVGCVFFLWICVKYLHKLPFRYLINPLNKVNWKKVFVGFGLWMLITLVFEGISYFSDPDNFILQFDPAKFFPLLLISMTLLFIQTSTEELLMRGYLMPAFGLIFKNKWVPLLITSVMFASLHFFNPEVQKYGLETMALNYILPGVFLGIITIMDDGLELALGVHWATNFTAATLVTFEGSALHTDAIFRMKNFEVSPIPWAFVIGGAIFCIVCAKLYNWRSFGYIFENLTFEDAESFRRNEEDEIFA